MNDEQGRQGSDHTRWHLSSQASRKDSNFWSWIALQTEKESCREANTGKRSLDSQASELLAGGGLVCTGKVACKDTLDSRSTS